jgi:hypothetical protein
LPRRKKIWRHLASRCCWNCARRLTCLFFSLCNKTSNSAHEQPLLSNDTIDFVLWHREVGRAKDLSAPLVCNGYVKEKVMSYTQTECHRKKANYIDTRKNKILQWGLNNNRQVHEVAVLLEMFCHVNW